MIRKCKVIYYNKFLKIIVFDFDGKQIQTTSYLDNDSNFIYAKFQNGKYEIVNKREYDKSIQENKKKEKKQNINSETKAENNNGEL